MRRFACVLIVIATLSAASPAWSQQAEPTESPVVVEEGELQGDSPIGQIIPAPNSGAAPRDAGDRGGALQLAVFGLILLFGVVAVWRVSSGARKAERAREEVARRAAEGPAAERSTATEPAGVDTADR